MKTAERVVIVLLLLILAAAAVWFYYAVQSTVALSETESGEVAVGELESSTINEEDQSDWRRYYPVTTPITIASTTVLASVADTLPERIKGLSDTPYLPENVVKLFVFESAGAHSIWMKDMQYPIDILWADREGVIVHIEENVSPDSFPNSFRSPTPAWYVIEANAGFAASEGIEVGSIMTRVEQS